MRIRAASERIAPEIGRDPVVGQVEPGEDFGQQGLSSRWQAHLDAAGVADDAGGGIDSLDEVGIGGGSRQPDLGVDALAINAANLASDAVYSIAVSMDGRTFARPPFGRPGYRSCNLPGLEEGRFGDLGSQEHLAHGCT